MKPYLRIVTIFLLSLCACSRSLDQYDALADKGVLPLSIQNGFLGANLYLSEEFSKSSSLFNFLKGRGGPNAISIETSRPLRLKMFYPLDKEFYIADLSDSDQHYEWVTRGPYRIDRRDYRELVGLFSSGVEEPAFQFQGKPFRFKPTRAEVLRMQEEAARAMATPTPIAKSKTKHGNTLTTKLRDMPKETPVPTPSVFQPLTFDQQALAMSQGFAERAQNGDVIHTVKKDGETIEAISNWYTGNPANGSELLKSNGIGAVAKLTPGMKIQIPKDKVKQFKAM
jgi:hypothetical protein